MAVSSIFGPKIGKPLLGIAVFLSVMVAWQQFGDMVTRHVSLPGADGPTGRCAIWFVGSSTMHRWRTMAEDMAPWQTANRGVDGAKVDDVAARLAGETVEARPGTMVVYLGENDIADGVSAEQTATKVSTMAADIQRRMPGVRTIVLGMKPSPTRWNFRHEQLRFNALVASGIRTIPNTTFADFGSVLLVDGRPGAYYDDGGIHLNRTGYRIWAGQIQSALQRVIPPADMARCSGAPARRT